MRGGGTAKRLEFEYTGTYNERLEDGVVELLTSGVLKFPKEVAIDAFLVGGGSSGGAGENKNATSGGYGGGGGAGGYTKTLLNIIPRANTEYPVVIGNGGAPVAPAAQGGSSGVKGQAGGTTSALGATAEGGKAGSLYMAGADGGSGGGGGKSTSSTDAQGNGGSDGSNGTQAQGSAGGGQGTTTREFGESTGKLYAGGGGGGGGGVAISSTNGGLGRDGGGDGGRAANGQDATANTGSGGGGAPSGYYHSYSSGAGGSGIVCIRLHQDDPTENVLSGTWKFNDTLTMPSTLFTENFDYDGTLAYAGSSLYAVMGVRELSSGKDLCFGHNPGDLSSNYVQVYGFTNNTWQQATAKTIKFWNRYQVVSPEFYAWFTANATKISD